MKGVLTCLSSTRFSNLNVALSPRSAYTLSSRSLMYRSFSTRVRGLSNAGGWLAWRVVSCSRRSLFSACTRRQRSWSSSTVFINRS